MKDKYDNFCKALERLKEALELKPTAVNMDATIKRFEFTYELSWKAIKVVLTKQGLECLSPRDCFKGAFQTGLIEDEEKWLDIIKDRNLTSHIYDENQAKKIYKRIKDIYFNLFVLLKKSLEAKI